MSLQGTLDTFALPDVLRLLAATRKTGHLRFDGERGRGNVWVDAGRVVAADTTTTKVESGAAEVVFELLRSRQGSFTFDSEATPPEGGTTLDVEPLLTEAEGLLAEWREIEAVVPSLAARLALAPDLAEPSVSVSSAQWRLLVSVGGGATVGAVGSAHDKGELDISRSVRDLVESGLVVVAAAGVDDAPVDHIPPRPAPTAVPGPASTGASPRVAAELEELAALAQTPAPASGGVDAPELARQLAQLGPDAAQAVAAAASAETPEERDAALATIEGVVDGEPVNHGLLLKFLSSVRS